MGWLRLQETFGIVIGFYPKLSRAARKSWVYIRTMPQCENRDDAETLNPVSKPTFRGIYVFLDTFLGPMIRAAQTATKSPYGLASICVK